jgi:hypothetical protein
MFQSIVTTNPNDLDVGRGSLRVSPPPEREPGGGDILAQKSRWTSVGGDYDASVEQHYPVILPASDSRGDSLANLILSTKTATTKAASVVSRPTVMLLVNPRTM